MYYPSNKTHRVTEGRYTTAIILNLASELSRSAPRVQFRNSLLMQLGFISPLLLAAASCWWHLWRRHRFVCRVSQRKFPVLDYFPGLCQVSLVDCFREAFLLYQVGDNDNAIIRPNWYAIFALTIWPPFQSASLLVLYLPCCPFAVRSKLAPWQSGENTHETTPSFFLSLAAHAERIFSRIFSHQSWSYRFFTRLLSGNQARSLRASF